MRSMEQAGQAPPSDGAEPAPRRVRLEAVGARRPRVAVVCDLLEEGWPSMDLVAEMLLRHLSTPAPSAVEAVRVRPRMVRRFGRLRFAGAARAGHNVDRVLNRFWDYPRHLRGVGDFDLFHVVDHSYAQLVHGLPPGRTVVTCHDLDTFRCLLGSPAEPRSKPFRMLMGRVLGGLRKAAHVTCDSDHTRDELLAYGLMPPERVTVVRNGVAPIFSPRADPPADAEAGRLLAEVPAGSPYVLHVGSTIPRKRVDVLLRVFANVRRELPDLRLVRVGGPFTGEQRGLLSRLGLEGAVVILPFVGERVLAAIYRGAGLVLQTSEREGFGLPVVEAMACGTPVLASDLAVLREVGGSAAVYCPVGDVAAWTEASISALAERVSEPDAWAERQTACVTRAAKFSWDEYTRRMLSIYEKLL